MVTQLIWKQSLIKAMTCLVKDKKDFDKESYCKEERMGYSKKRLLKKT